MTLSNRRQAIWCELLEVGSRQSEHCMHQVLTLMRDGCNVRDPDVVDSDWKMWECCDEEVVKEAHIDLAKNVLHLH